MMNVLEKARIEINDIDEKMAQLFEMRMRAVEDVISYKMQNDMPVLDSGREQFVIDKNIHYIKNPQYKDYYVDFITHLMTISKLYQKKISNADTVGYQGTKGAFSHIALTNLFKDHKEKSFQTFEEVFKAVQSGEISCGVLPFENSYTGEVGEVLDLLYKYNCSINEIYDLKINHNLLGVDGVKLSEIKQVYSHYQALSQCKHYFDAFSYELIEYPNTALAAKYVSEANDKTKAAVASIETAKLYNLDVLVKDINTSAENTTRFIVISKTQNEVGNRFNIMFTLDHNAGQLAKIMQIISKYGFNMESIKSKSIKNLPWQYYFYVEIVGNIKDENAKTLISELEENCKELKVLGVYNK